jgi:NTP pyrophosphatase (non-canonical NTP hydrolase)
MATFDIVDLTAPGMPLSFDRVASVNALRCARWHGPDWIGHGDPWTIADWSNAMQGESGEAGNVVKKMRSLECGFFDNRPSVEMRMLVDNLGEELADTYLYMDLLATKVGIYLPAAIVRKFNAVSVRNGFPERL